MYFVFIFTWESIKTLEFICLILVLYFINIQKMKSLFIFEMEMNFLFNIPSISKHEITKINIQFYSNEP